MVSLSKSMITWFDLTTPWWAIWWAGSEESKTGLPFDGRSVTVEDARAVAAWLKTRSSDREIAYRPARVLMQDFTGVPAVVDLAAMRDAMVARGADPAKINPLVQVDLVIDHSVMVDRFGGPEAFAENVRMEFERNRERYEFLR